MDGLVLRDFDNKQNPQTSVQSPEEIIFSSGTPEFMYNCELLTASLRLLAERMADLKKETCCRHRCVTGIMGAEMAVVGHVIGLNYDYSWSIYVAARYTLLTVLISRCIERQ